MRTAVATLALCACAPLPGESPPAAFIAPLDGQTAVPAGLDLLVSTRGIDLPEDYPLSDDVIRVVDLDDGGLIRGTVLRDGAELRFRAAGGWEPGHRYLWSVSEPPSAAREPTLELPDEVLGDASFEAGTGRAVLDAGVDGSGQLCLLLSLWLDVPPTDLALELDGAPVDPTWYLRDEWATARAAHLLPGDPGVSLACATELAPRRGQGLRVAWGDEPPVWFVLDAVDAVDLSADERRRGG